MERKSYDEMRDHEESHWWFVARRRILCKVMSRLLPEVADRKVLEIGCGSGGNFQLLREFGLVHAVELDDDMREQAQKRGGFPVKKGALPDSIPYTETFDLICLLDVLEHVDEDESSLSVLHKKLNSDGTLLITVPAYQWLWSRHDEDHHHKRRYTRKQLVKQLENAGYSVTYASYFNSVLFVPIVLVRFLKKLTKNTNPDVGQSSGFANRILKTCFSIESHVLPWVRLPFGLSILVRAEKI